MNWLKSILIGGIMATIFLLLFYIGISYRVLGLLKLSVLFTVGISILYFMKRCVELGEADKSND